MLIKKFLFFLFSFSVLFSAAQNNWASHVFANQFGLGQTVGQDSAYFPKNVIGAVNSNVSATVPANTPNEIVSLGRNGWVALSFEGNIINEDGADFTVFENAFQFAGGIFDEWLIVSVSQDGNAWFTFPYDSLTGAGMAGRTPTNGGGNVNYLDPTQSGGDSFDLADLGLAWAKYVKVTDATKFQTPDKLSAELDAIVAIHLQTSAISSENLTQFIDIQYNEDFATFSVTRPLQLELWDMNGQKLAEKELFPAANPTLLIRNLANGVYIWRIADGQKMQSIKWIKRE
jgi:hypothetical protein